MNPCPAGLKRTVRVVGVVLALVVVTLLTGAVWLHFRLNASLPTLDGELRIAGLVAPVAIERDDQGIPTVRGESRMDVARATGFLHAQDRFFQMDLLRREAAGELAALIGPAVAGRDRQQRVHRFRAVAEAGVASVDERQRELLEAYAAGVNAGLAALGAPPPEYTLLRVDPDAWTPTDTMLVVLSMYLQLQGDRGRRESNLGLLEESVPGELFEFLAAGGTPWDAPIAGDAIATPPVPGAHVFDLHGSAPGLAAELATEPRLVPGSNGWAVAGEHTADGRALLASDMHLPLSMPNIWYRACLTWPDANGAGIRVTGVTLPGAPLVIVGSNGHVAWGFTNSQVDVSDLILLDSVDGDDARYRTAEGPRRIERITERIRVKGEEDRLLEVEWTVWGPVIDRDHRGRRRVLRWVAHDPGSVDLGLMGMERARTVDEALDVAVRARIPTQNCQIADQDGRIGWTLMGPIPRRVGFNGRVPRSWARDGLGWDGTLAPEEVPRVVDPPLGRIWTANNRVVGGDLLRRVGDGGFAMGARARQIRDGLLALDAATERDMLAVQLDDRAVFLERWRELLLQTLTPEAVGAESRRDELRKVVEETWTGRASVDSAGFRLVRAFRLRVIDEVFGALTASCREADEQFSYGSLSQLEGALWRLVTERPRHLLDARFESWDEQLLSAVDTLLDRFPSDAGPLDDRTWGQRNTVAVQHPISLAVPQLAGWLDVAPRPLPGAGNMPRVQSVRFGASMRLAVSPGHEADGILHMPGGQSGHPRSPYYRQGHEAWAEGRPTPFLPGPPTHTLTLTP